MKNLNRSILSWISSGFKSLDKHVSYLKDNFNNHHIGIAERHGGYKPRLLMEKGILQLVQKHGFGKYFKAIPDVKESELDTVLGTQKEFMSKRKRIGIDYSRMVQATVRVAEHLQKYVSSALMPQNVSNTLDTLNMQASAGYPYYRKKGAVKNALLSDFNKLKLDELRLFPTMVAFRISLGRKVNDIVRKIRCIYPYPGVVTLHELRFLNPFMTGILNTGSFYATGLTGSQISDRILHGGRNYKYNFSTDISKFDLNMPIELIQSSFACLRSCFKLSKNDAVIFEFLRDYFCTSYFSSRVGKGKGSTYIKLSGLPSGSGFTNLIGTIAHAIMLEYYEPHFLSNNYCNICSDDNLFFSNKNYSYSDVVNMYIPWGMQPNRDECQFCNNIDKIFFLGFDWLKLLDILMCP